MTANILDVFLVFLKFGLMSFGGGQVTLAEMQRELVSRGWLTHMEFMESFAIGQLSPGPGALYVVPMGYKAAGIGGGLAAAAGYLVPTAAVAMVAILLWSRVRTSRWPAAVREALVPVTLGLLFASTYTMGRVILGDWTGAAVALVSLTLLWRTSVPTPFVLLGSGVCGAVVLGQPWH